jgi:hypothetical protein
MLVDRVFNSRFDSLEFERENGYRHPPLYIVTLLNKRERREEQAENCVENIHV